MPTTPTHVRLLRDAQVSVSKALAQLAFIDRSYGLGLWKNQETRQVWQHDLELMAYHGDLKRLALHLMDRCETILFEFEIAFDASPETRSNEDIARGIELPVLDCTRIAGHRVVVFNNGRRGQYEHLLKAKRSKAKTLSTRATDAFESEHARTITGGRQSGKFSVAPEARHRLVVTRAGTKPYAFGRDVDLGVEGVFLDLRQAPAQFSVGERITAIVIQTPRGLQARNIQTGWPTDRHEC